MNSIQNGHDARVVALIVAAGSGTRMHAGVPKAFLPLVGVSLLERSVRTLLKVATHAVVMVPTGKENEARALLKKYAVTIASGGVLRSDSVRLGLAEVERLTGHQDQEIVAVHDAARCLVSEEDVREVVRIACYQGAATLVTPQVDSLLRADPQGQMLEMVPRQHLYAVQTPQVFRFELLARAHASALASQATDDASLVLLVHPVSVVESSAPNLKITTPHDLIVAEHLLKLNLQSIVT
jgi:2-C-methyl-D-erythritol 4-phosphate cytidylyltransferase